MIRSLSAAVLSMLVIPLASIMTALVSSLIAFSISFWKIPALAKKRSLLKRYITTPFIG